VGRTENKKVRTLARLCLTMTSFGYHEAIAFWFIKKQVQERRGKA
jgi:hypothetical protein